MCRPRKTPRADGSGSIKTTTSTVRPATDTTRAPSIRNYSLIRPLLKKKSVQSPLQNWQMSRVYGEQVHCWILPLNLSQSRFADRTEISSACTLITVMFAKYLFYSNGQMPSKRILNTSTYLPMMDFILPVLANSIIEGNEHHAAGMTFRRIMKKTLTVRQEEEIKYFSIPQALELISGTNEIDWGRSSTLNDLPNYIQMAVNHELLQDFHQLFFPTIISQRAFLILFDRKQQIIALIDGHAHYQNKELRVGAIVIMADYDNLISFCQVALEKLFSDLKPDSEKFEITCLQLMQGHPPPGIVVLDHKPSEVSNRAITVRFFPRPE